MKTQELNEQELIEINGGSFLGLGNSNAGTSQSGLAGGLNIGSLLSFTSVNKSGNRETTTSFSLGNNLILSLQQLTNSIFN